MTVTSPGDWTQTKGPVVNLRVALDGKSASFTPSQDGLYEFRCSSAPEAFEITVGGTEVPPTPEPEVPPTPQPEPQPQEGLLWDSNINGKWNDGNKRTITVKEGNQQPNDKSIFVAASGSPKLVVDGNGVAHLISGSGGVSNLSFKGRSRHGAGGDPENRFGGIGAHISKTEVGFKIEKYHNEHEQGVEKSFSPEIKDYEWHTFDFEYKDVTGGIDQVFKLDGTEKLRSTFKNPPAYYTNKTLYNTLSYFWIRLNNADHGRIYVMANNYNARIKFDFMFEPKENSIAIRNVRLVAV